MLHRGATGYLLKNMQRTELLEAIGKVMDGKIFLRKQQMKKCRGCGFLLLFSTIAPAIRCNLFAQRQQKGFPLLSASPSAVNLFSTFIEAECVNCGYAM